LTDLAGFLGAEPKRAGKEAVAQGAPTGGAAQGRSTRQESVQSREGSRATLLPDTPISLPRLNWADIHLTYRGHRIEGRSMPLDDLAVALDIVDGAVRLHPVSFGVGQGRIVLNAALTPQNDKTVRANVDIDLRRIDVGRLMAATHAFGGAGTISGTGRLDTVGTSFASFLANGNGGLRFGMAGGDLSALLVDLSGLQFGNAILSALGVPQRTKVECLVGDLPHAYLYIINNIGEAVIAKRRSYATLVSHLTPPFAESDLYGPLKELQTAIGSWQSTTDEALKAELVATITRVVREQKIDRDLGLPESSTPLDEDQIEHVHDYLMTVGLEKITRGLYTLGVPYPEDRVIETAR
ncbi:MAG: cobaltochelatase subunit CobN, partial [Rhodospirillales bacterium]|nr:cobaltochelatase subunit CobN [Rhodospirillales bacterium]